MKRRSVPLLPAVVLCCGWLCFTAVPAARAGQADGPVLAVPPGFVVEPVAGPLLVQRPVVACFDDRGRLYVAESAGADQAGEEPAGRTPGRIVVLEDIDGDGRFDRSGVFADGLASPQGLLWHDGAVLVASPPGLWRLRDAMPGATGVL